MHFVQKCTKQLKSNKTLSLKECKNGGKRKNRLGQTKIKDGSFTNAPILILKVNESKII